MKRVAVIGAGAAGLAALRSLSRFQHKIEVVAFERSNRVGGTWVHNDPFKPTSMYDNLTTNLPKEAMAFPGSPFPSAIQHSFLNHQEVLGYLESFAKQNNLHEKIKFRHSVQEVDPISFSRNGSASGWNVDVRNEKTSDKLSMQPFDSVIVCNGHYSDPYIPDLPGMETYLGRLLHSHSYRTPSAFRDQTVLVLGAGPSGKDIAADLVPEAKKVYLSHNNDPVAYETPDIVEEVPGIRQLHGSFAELLDGRRVEPDVLLMATGYRYSFPFLSKKCHPVVRKEHIEHLHKFIVDIQHPSLYFIGLNKDGLSFPQYHLQAEYAAACIAGVFKQKSREEMLNEYDAMYKKLVTDKKREAMFYHCLDLYQWDYHEQLSTESRVPNLDQGLEKLYWHVVDRREFSFSDFKTAVYRINDDKTSFKSLYEPDENVEQQKTLDLSKQ